MNEAAQFIGSLFLFLLGIVGVLIVTAIIIVMLLVIIAAFLDFRDKRTIIRIRKEQLIQDPRYDGTETERGTDERSV